MNLYITNIGFGEPIETLVSSHLGSDDAVLENVVMIRMRKMLALCVCCDRDSLFVFTWLWLCVCRRAELCKLPSQAFAVTQPKNKLLALACHLMCFSALRRCRLSD